MSINTFKAFCSKEITLSIAKESDTQYASLKTLDSIMNLISPQQFKCMANEAGLREIEAKAVTLESGKPFYIGTYTKI